MIAKNLKILRSRKGWTQKKAAYNLEMGRSKYQSYEDGRAEPSIKVILRVADLYEVTTDQLLRSEIVTEIINVN